MKKSSKITSRVVYDSKESEILNAIKALKAAGINVSLPKQQVFHSSKAVAKPYKTKKAAAKPVKKADDGPVVKLFIVDYSEKSFAVFGTTKPHAAALAGMKGRFNRWLQYNGEKVAGWIFANSHRDDVESYIATL